VGQNAIFAVFASNIQLLSKEVCYFMWKLPAAKL